MQIGHLGGTVSMKSNSHKIELGHSNLLLKTSIFCKEERESERRERVNERGPLKGGEGEE